MSLAQRRTAPESVDLTARTEDIGDDPVVSTEEDVGSSPRARRQTVWRTLSYDAFGGQELTHYESFPPEITTASHLAAYDVSTLRRAGKLVCKLSLNQQEMTKMWCTDKTMDEL